MATTIALVPYGTLPRSDYKSKLVDWSDATLDRELRTYSNDRQLLMTKAALALFRADRLETDPARKRVAKAEADRAFERFRAAARDATRLGKGDGAIRTAPR